MTAKRVETIVIERGEGCRCVPVRHTETGEWLMVEYAFSGMRAGAPLFCERICSHGSSIREAEKDPLPDAGKGMTCDRCGSTRLLWFGVKCSDRLSLDGAGFEDYEGYVPEGILRGVDPEPWQRGDYLHGELCLDCGKLQGEFPAQIEAARRVDEVG